MIKTNEQNALKQSNNETEEVLQLLAGKDQQVPATSSIKY